MNCVIESLQGFCNIENLVMKDCTLVNSPLVFEYSSIDVDIKGRMDSIINPASGTVSADEIGVVIMDEEWVDVNKTKICCRNGKEPSHLTSSELTSSDIELILGQGNSTK